MSTHNRLIVGDSERNADLLYAIGMMIPDPVLWFSVKGEEHIILSPLEIGRGTRELKPGIKPWSYHDAKQFFSLKSLRLADQIAGVSKHYRIKKWQVPRSFPLGLAERLAKNGLRFDPVNNEFFPERQQKSGDEVNRITAGVRLAEAGLNHGLNILRSATIKANALVWNDALLTAEILRGEINAQIARQGGVADHTIVACGVQGADPHCRGEGNLCPHQPIIIDIFPRVSTTGYWGDLTRTVVKGRASSVVKDAFAAVHSAKRAALSRVKAGITGNQVHRAVVAILKHAGFNTDLKANPPHGFIHGTGHGLGLEIHEAPRVNKSRNMLRENNVVTIEPGLYYPEWGGIRIEDVVVVKKDGCQNLTTVPVFLEIP